MCVEVDGRRKRLHRENVELVSSAEPPDDRAEVSQTDQPDRFGKNEKCVDGPRSHRLGKVEERARQSPRLRCGEHGSAESYIPVPNAEVVSK